MLNPDYLNPYGIWQMTTEGDCEGKSTRNLGVYSGRLDDIAFALAGKAMYSLTFKKLDLTVPTLTEGREKVNVVLDIDSGTWGMAAEERVAAVREMLKGAEDIFVSNGNTYASVTLSRGNHQASVRKAALAKLTDEEKATLGLL